MSVGEQSRSLLRGAMARCAIFIGAVVLAGCSGVPADATGPDIYSLSCARCHGSELEGGVGPPLGAGSAAAEKTDDHLVTTISRGAGRMPSFSGALTEDQIVSVVAFLRERQAE
jgi:mono/diheme cytochrome c family protein